MKLWLATLLSALLFSGAFIFPDYIGWGILLFPIPIYWVIKKTKKTFLQTSLLQNTFLFGFVWGVVAFGAYFFWLFTLLRTRSNATLLFSFLLYACVVVYFALTSAVWFWASCTINFTVTTIAYFIFLTQFSLWFFPGTSKFPFLNPILPLIHTHQTNTYQFKSTLFITPQNIFSDMSDLKIYETLKKLNLKEVAQKYKTVCVCLPESSYAQPLDTQPNIIKMWSRALLPDNVHLLIGGVRKEAEKWHQTIYQIHQCRVIRFYDKKHCVGFTENMDNWWGNFAWARNLFLKNRIPISPGTQNQTDYFEFSKNMRVVPYMCSEFFVQPFKKDITKSNLLQTGLLQTGLFQTGLLQIVFLNDSWFSKCFRKLMFRYVTLKSWFYQRPTFIVSYSDFRISS